MFKLELKSIRPKEDLVLSGETNIQVPGKIVQYLLTYQISGIRFLFNLYKKQKSAILNDEPGSGKCFSCVAFMRAIFSGTSKAHFLILCANKQKLVSWKYHFDCLLDKNVKIQIIDECNDVQPDVDSNAINLCSIDAALSNFQRLKQSEFTCLIVQDRDLKLSADTLKRLEKIKATTKIVLCSHDLMTNCTYLYKILQLCGQLGPLQSYSERDKILDEEEFKLKYGYTDDRTISQRNKLFRKRNLLNACGDFYLRRQGNELSSRFSMIDDDVIKSNFNKWKANFCDTEPINTPNGSEESCLQSTIGEEDYVAEIEKCATADKNESLLNNACVNAEEFDTQMSPLIYYANSESETEEDLLPVSQRIDIASSSDLAETQQLSDEIFCNQEHTRRVLEAKIKAQNEIDKYHQNQPSTSRQSEKSVSNQNIRPKRFSYKKLPFKTQTSNRTIKKSEEATRKAPTKKSHKNTSKNDVFEKAHHSKQRRVSNQSDVQIITQKLPSPIYISNSSSTDHDTKHDAQFDTEILCMSPDLFGSFNSSAKSKTSKKSNEHEDGAERSAIDGIELLSNTKADIFEITENDVFHNILSSFDDKITPVKDSTPAQAIKPKKSCLTGLRIHLPRLNIDQIERVQSELKSAAAATKPVNPLPDSDVILLKDSQESDVQIISSGESGESCDPQRTPERNKRELVLTPSTRSCLKRSSQTDQSVERKKTTPTTTGWITKKQISPGDTPRSRLRLVKWSRKTDENTAKAENKLSKPRNLCKEFKSTVQPAKHRNLQTPMAQSSPNIFSDED